MEKFIFLNDSDLPKYLYRALGYKKITELNDELYLDKNDKYNELEKVNLSSYEIYEKCFKLRTDRNEKYISFYSNDPIEIANNSDKERVRNIYSILESNNYNAKPNSGLVAISPKSICEVNPKGRFEEPIVGFIEDKHPHYGMVYCNHEMRHLVFQAISRNADVFMPKKDFV